LASILFKTIKNCLTYFKIIEILLYILVKLIKQFYILLRYTLITEKVT